MILGAEESRLDGAVCSAVYSLWIITKNQRGASTELLGAKSWSSVKVDHVIAHVNVAPSNAMWHFSVYPMMHMKPVSFLVICARSSAILPAARVFEVACPFTVFWNPRKLFVYRDRGWCGVIWLAQSKCNYHDDTDKQSTNGQTDGRTEAMHSSWQTQKAAYLSSQDSYQFNWPCTCNIQTRKIYIQLTFHVLRQRFTTEQRLALACMRGFMNKAWDL